MDDTTCTPIKRRRGSKWYQHAERAGRFCTSLLALAGRVSWSGQQSRPICSKMRIIMGKYVPIRTCSLVCKVTICALVFIGAALNIAGLFVTGDSDDGNTRRGKRMVDDFNDYSVHQSDDTVAQRVLKEQDNWAVKRRRREGASQHDVDGIDNDGWQPAGVFSSNMDPVAPKGNLHGNHEPLLPPDVILNNLEPNKEKKSVPVEKQMAKKENLNRNRLIHPDLPAVDHEEMGRNAKFLVSQSGHQMSHLANKPQKDLNSEGYLAQQNKDYEDEYTSKADRREFVKTKGVAEAYSAEKIGPIHKKASKKQMEIPRRKPNLKKKSKQHPRLDITSEKIQKHEEEPTTSTPPVQKPSKLLIVSYSFDVDRIIGAGLNSHPGIFYMEDPQLLFDSLFQTVGLSRGGTMLKRNVVRNALDLMGDALQCRFVKHHDVLSKEPNMVWDVSAFKTYFEENCAPQNEDPQSFQQRRKRQNGDEAGEGPFLGGYKDQNKNFEDYLLQAKESLVPDDDAHSDLDPLEISQCLEKACEAADVIAVRSTRLPFKDLETYWSSRKRADFPGMKILVLLRDPRAIIYKGQKDHHLAFRLDGAGRVYMAASDLCSRMLADIENLERFTDEMKQEEVATKGSDFVMVLKEEEFLKRPAKVLSKIYSFVGTPLPKERQFRAIVNSLSSEVRLSLNITKSWRSSLALPDLINIDRACQHFYKSGYYSSVTTRSQRDRVEGENEEDFQKRR